MYNLNVDLAITAANAVNTLLFGDEVPRKTPNGPKRTTPRPSAGTAIPTVRAAVKWSLRQLILPSVQAHLFPADQGWTQTYDRAKTKTPKRRG
ncbi:hypothetical protein NQ317_000106 [Molorchus minor]|uniref:Uncharacterized protein n=1 Tax=Molorchus minor TaxID=1323400 RepID=A0ABQ9J027_9CUCU|nr:hypothetical protein NQ317_000106 [Molorchus minor]